MKAFLYGVIFCLFIGISAYWLIPIAAKDFNKSNSVSSDTRL